MFQNHKGILRYLGGTLILIGIGITVVAGFTTRSEWFTPIENHEEPVVGAIAPDFKLATLNGEEIRLVDLRGKPVIINFWATWCAPCVIEMPILQEYSEIYDLDIEVLAINADEPSAKVQEFIDEIGVTFTILMDPGAILQELYRIRGYPTTFFLDAKGIIRAQHIGLLNEEQIGNYLLEVGVGDD